LIINNHYLVHKPSLDHKQHPTNDKQGSIADSQHTQQPIIVLCQTSD